MLELHHPTTGRRWSGPGLGLAVVAACCLMTAGCGLRTVDTSPAPRTGGTVYVYLQPISGTAERLSLEVGQIAALREDGSRTPLSLRLASLGGEATRRERLLAVGSVPPGSYAGLSLVLDRARVRRPEGQADLRLPDTPTSMGSAFRLGVGEVVVLSLALRARESMADEFGFVPSFTVGAPLPVATGLLGVVSSREANAVTLFDKVSGRVAAVVPTGSRPAGMALDRRRGRVYVALSGADAIEALDLQETKIVNRLRLNGGDGVSEIALSPDGRTLLSANSGSNSVSFIDALSFVEVDRVPVGNRPGSVTIDPAGRRAYALNTAAGTITVLDLTQRRVAGSIAVDAGPFRGQFNRAGDRLFVIHQAVPYLTVVDPASLSVVERIYVGSEATALKLDPRTDRLYLARRNSGSIDVYDPFSLQPVDSIPVRGDVTHLAIDDEGNNLCLVEPDARRVRILRVVGKQTIAETDVGVEPVWAVLMGER